MHHFSQEKVINFTPTGTQTTRENSLAPLEVNEIIEEVHSAYELGITIVHLHARDENLQNTYKVEFYQKIIEGLRKFTPDLIICTSLTGRNFTELDKRTEVLQLRPDLASLTLSSLNFPTGVSGNSPEVIHQLLHRMHIWGVIPELECFDLGMINWAKILIENSQLAPPYYFNIILGNPFSAQNDLQTVSAIKSIIPENSITTIGGISKQQLYSNTLGLMYFDGIRIGLEDNLKFRQGELATNSQLLKRVHRIMNELDLEVMSAQKLKSLGYANRHSNNR